jgi:multiple sugar transport system substrate-binding protein/arabinosaccharide transport system substrate-binding protein
MAGLAGGLTLAAACTPATTPDGQAPAADAGVPSAEATTITMWTHDNLYVEFFNSRGEKWKADHTDKTIEFDFQQIPYGEVFTKVLANLAAGSGAPDLVGIEISVFSRFMKGDIADKGLVPFNDLIGDEKDKFLRWDPYTYKGNLYGVESALCPVGYWYQPALFEKAGVELPATWEEFAEAGVKLKEATNATLLPVDDLGAGLFNMLFQQRDQHLFSEDGALTLNTPEAVEVLKFILDAANSSEVFFKTGADSYWGAATLTAYKDGAIAGAVMPDWYHTATLAGELKDMAGQWQLAKMPTWKNGSHKTSTWGGTGFGITKQSKDAPLVWDLLHYVYLTKEGQVERFQQIGYYPHMIEAFTDPGVMDKAFEFCGGQKIGTIFAEVATDIPTQFQSPFWEEAQRALNDQITLAFAGDVGPEEAIQAATDGIKTIMEKGA